jgi:hypothetical protein
LEVTSLLMRVHKKELRNTKYLSYMSLVCPNLEYDIACWDQCRGQINALDRVQQNVVQFTVHIKESDGETVAERRTIARLCALLKAFCGERA